METINLLKVKSETRKTVKQQVIRLHKKGTKGRDIAEMLNLSEYAVSRIVRSYKKEGMDCIKELPRGRKHGEYQVGLPRPTLVAIGTLEPGTVKSREFETLTQSGEERTSAPKRTASKAIRSVPYDRDIESRIKSRVPVLLERKLVDPVYPTWHSPRALGEVFKGVLEICRSQAR